MAAFNKRRNGDGSTSWDAAVSVVGYPRTSKSFRSKFAAELWAARTEDARRGRTPTSRRGMTLGHLLDEALPRLANPTTAVFAYWRAELGDVPLAKISPELIALHRDRLLGAACRGHRHKRTKPRSPAIPAPLEVVDVSEEATGGVPQREDVARPEAVGFTGSEVTLKFERDLGPTPERKGAARRRASRRRGPGRPAEGQRRRATGRTRGARSAGFGRASCGR